MRERMLSLRPTPLRVAMGIAVTGSLIAVETVLGYTLKRVASTETLGIFYLLGIVIVSTVWGFWLGAVTAFFSAVTMDYFFIPPLGSFFIYDNTEQMMMVVIFVAVALLVGYIANLAQSRAVEADDRLEELLHAARERELIVDALLTSRNELAASRARIVVAADESRRRIERDLHDGVQQRLVSLGLKIRAAEAMVPAELEIPRAQLSQTARDLAEVLKDVQEVSRGLHPPILSNSGLGAALKALARRSPIPVEVNVHLDQRLAERVEIAVYYIVSEALTNAAKHAHASVVYVDLEKADAILRLCVRDDGAGGADPARGSGLIGLKDRVEVLGGTIEITSTPGSGTALLVKIPIEGG
jgi:signal transduction histidine kinase